MDEEQEAQYERAARARGARSVESLDRSLDRRYGGGGGDSIHVIPPIVIRGSSAQSVRSLSSSSPHRLTDSQSARNDREHRGSQNTVSGTVRGRSRSRGIRRERATRASASERATNAMESLYEREGKIRSELLHLQFVKLQLEAQASAQKIRTLAAEELYWSQKAKNEINLLNNVPTEAYTAPVFPQVSTDIILTQSFSDWVSQKFPPNTFDRCGLNLGIQINLQLNNKTLIKFEI